MVTSIMDIHAGYSYLNHSPPNHHVAPSSHSGNQMHMFSAAPAAATNTSTSTTTSRPSRYRKQQQRAQRGPPLHLQTDILPNTQEIKSSASYTNSNDSAACSFIATINIKYPAPSTKVISWELRGSEHIGEVISRLIASREHELGSDPEDYLLWETMDMGNGLVLRRPLRNTEIIDSILSSWPRFGSQFGMQLQNSRIRLDTVSLAFLSPRRDILREPRFNGTLSYAKGVYTSAAKWASIRAEITPDGTLTLNSPTKGTILRALKIAELDVYEGLQGPFIYSLTFRSQLNPDCFADFDEAFHHFSTTSYQDYDALRNICYTLRSQAVEKLARQVVNGSIESPLKPQQLSKSNNTSPVHTNQSQVMSLGVNTPSSASLTNSNSNTIQHQATHLLAKTVLPLSNTNMAASLMLKQQHQQHHTQLPGSLYITRRL